MNIHVPQSLQTRNELVQLASVPTQILTPKDSKPIVSVVQDVALGIYRLTKGFVTLSEKQMFNLVCSNPKFFGRMPEPMSNQNGVKKWSGRQVLSTIIPANINFKGPNNSYDDRADRDDENFVKIECGEIVQGRLDTKVYQDRSRGLIHSIYNEYGPTETRVFFDNTQQLICNWLVLSGFSVGISDLVVDPTTMKSLSDNIHQMKVKVYEIIRDVHMDNFKNDTRKSNNDKFEEEVNKILNEAIDKSGKVGLKTIDDVNNRMINMIKAGSKGNIPNIAQMIACLGQQNVDGKRIAYGFDNRTLPHYNKYDDGPESRGFVENSFIKGLTPQEFFFHSMGGREGLIDTAVKSVTADTPIVIVENGQARRVCIGPWIDGQLDASPGEVMKYDERNLELLNLHGGKVYIPTTDENGIVNWGPVVALTRHDPGEVLYKIKTRSGREVIVTESKSLIVWKPDLQQFHETPTPEICVGDAVPVTAILADPPNMTQEARGYNLDRETGVLVGRYLSRGTKAREALHAYLDGLCQSHTCLPEEAFNAPREFVSGIVAGYITGDPTCVLTRKIVRAKTATRELAEGLAMLLSRLGVFASIEDEAITVVSPWASRLIDMYGLDSTDPTADDEIATKLYRQHNDVVLDPIASIEKVGIEEHPKVYDLTIPTTLNFGLANGLQVRDTSQTGYIQRKLVKAMEDCKVTFDMTVRNANGNIIQFLYGEDGMDAIKIESQPLPYVTMVPKKLEETYLITVKDDLATVMSPDKLNAFVAKYPGYHKDCFAHYKQVMSDREFLIKRMFRGEQESSVMYPVSFVRIINNTHAMYSKYKCDGVLTDLDPIYVLHEIEKLTTQLRVSNGSGNNTGTKLFGILVRANMSPKRMIMHYGFTKAAFDQIVQMVKMRFYDSIVNPSEMVGVLAAQSIGEPLSQLTLNTFHLSGISSASKAVRGVPRVEELTRVTKNVKAPSMLVYLKPEYTKDEEKCKELKNRIETTLFKDVVKTSKIYYEPNDLNTTIEDDAKLVELYNTFNLTSEAECNKELSPWLLRFDIDKGKMLDMDLTMIDLNVALTSHFGSSRVSCMFADDSAANLVFRIKLNTEDSSSPADTLTDLKALESTILEHIIVKGVDKVNKVELQKRNDMFVYNQDTQAFEKTHEWYLDTDGTNLGAVLGIPWVDATRTVCNDVNEIYKLFGIEAARQCLYNELNEVIKDQANINYRHLSILVDTMTTKGALMSIDRHGINKGDIGPLAKCSFEEVNDVLVKAGVFSEFDKINGVSANIMLGQIAQCGTGDTEVLIDEAMLKAGNASTVAFPDRDGAEDGQVDTLGACHIDNLSFDFKVPTADPNIKKIKIDMNDVQF